MIQSTYVSVSNGQITPCGKRPKPIKSEPIPLLKENYLHEFRTEVEKAKARANLGIGDAYSLQWGNITGHIEDNQDLVKFIEQQWKYSYSSEYIKEEIKTVKEALDYALYFVSTYEANDAAVVELKGLVSELDTQLSNLSSRVTTNSGNITLIQEDISKINDDLDTINEKLKNIDVDQNIQDWVSSHVSGSKTIYLDESNILSVLLEVKISKKDDNALKIETDGLYVKDQSQDIADAKAAAETATQKSEDVENQMKEIAKNFKYVATLPEDTTAPGLNGITVGDLKDKGLSEIIDTLFFPEIPPVPNYPSLYVGELPELVKVGTFVQWPEANFYQGDAGETSGIVNEILYNGSPVDIAAYTRAGQYTINVSVSYKAGEYLKNNRGDVTTQRVEAGTLSESRTIEVTYPWYAGNENGVTEQPLIPVDTYTEYLEFTAGSKVTVKIPGTNSIIESLQVDGGLGYLPVTEEDWSKTTETSTLGIDYIVYQKKSAYIKDLKHRIKFKIVI